MSAPAPLDLSRCLLSGYRSSYPRTVDETKIPAIKQALEDAGFTVSEDFYLQHDNASTVMLSMRTPIEGESSPRTVAKSRCPEGFGPNAMSQITGNCSNGMMGRGLTLMNGGTVFEHYMTRIMLYGQETFIPVLVEVRMVATGRLEIGRVLAAELMVENA